MYSITVNQDMVATVKLSLLNRQNYLDSQFAPLDFDTQNQQLYIVFVGCTCFSLFSPFALIRDLLGQTSVPLHSLSVGHLA
jgi:hypothetical protein